MEKIIDFDTWYAEFKPLPVEYVAVFNPETGAVISVGPSHAFKDEKYKIPVDQELAESIINAEIKINSCLVDINSNSIEIAEIKSVFKIDDVLHRIISDKFSDIKKPDICLTYDSKKQTLKIELSKEFEGTYNPKVPFKKRKIVWDGDTKMDFFITSYNDPNVLFQIISVKINDLVGKSKIIKNFNYENFSVYTRRLFKNYIIKNR